MSQEKPELGAAAIECLLQFESDIIGMGSEVLLQTAIPNTVKGRKRCLHGIRAVGICHKFSGPDYFFLDRKSIATCGVKFHGSHRGSAPVESS